MLIVDGHEQVFPAAKVLENKSQENLKLNSDEIFPKLPSFNVIAIVLSYHNFSQRVETLMQLLSKKTYIYFNCHVNILKSFLVKWQPRFTRVSNF